MLTQSRLKELLNYDLETGIFTRIKIPLGSHDKVGDIAGTRKINSYVSIRVDGKLYKAHRLAFLHINGSMPSDLVDHINGIQNDNRWHNLRECTNSQNCMNKTAQSNNTSGHKGVVWVKSKNKWCARIKVMNKSISLGDFKVLSEAVEAYRVASLKYHGEFSNLK